MEYSRQLFIQQAEVSIIHGLSRFVIADSDFNCLCWERRKKCDGRAFTEVDDIAATSRLDGINFNKTWVVTACRSKYVN